MSLKAKVSRGKYEGTPLFPHLHEDGMYVATRTRYKADYVRVKSLEQLEALVQQGYGARMSNPDITNAPSFIVNKNIEVSAKENNLLKSLSKAIEDLDLDPDSLTKRRAEQSLLRAFLLNSREHAPCILCGRDLPENMLVAAHIKKRSKCSTEEKLDFGNVAALMCKLGCDDLFEKKYVYVSNGRLVGNFDATLTDSLRDAIKDLEGNTVSNWSSSEKYYIWHAKQST
jgi:hypothetical protein